MHRFMWMAVALGLSTVLAGCGGPSQPSTDTVTERQGKAFAKALQPLCRESQAFQRDADLEFPRAPLDLAVGAERMRKLIELEATNDAAYAKLQPPAHLSAAYRDFTDNRAKIARQRAVIAAAMEQGDLDAAKAEDAKFAQLNDERREATSTLAACQDDLSKAERTKVIATLTEFATSDDAAEVCSEIVVVAALPLFYEGPDYAADCRSSIEEQASRKALAKGIKVAKVDGWDKIVATVSYVDAGGEFDGRDATAKLYYVDGAWRVFSVS